MYNTGIVQIALKSLIGFKNTRTPDLDSLSAFLLATLSGRYYDEFHPLVKLVNIDASAPDFDSYTTAAYAGGTAYLKGQIVSDGGSLFRSVAGTAATPNTGNATSDLAWWEAFTYLSGYCEDIVLGAIPKMLSRSFATKKTLQSTKEIFADLKLYQGAGNITRRITKSGRFCGFDVSMKYMKDLVMEMPQIGVQLDTLQASLNIYIYHSSQSAPIYSFDLNITKAISFGWYSLVDDNGDNPVLKFVTDNYQAGGSFYIGYYEADLTGQAVKHNIDLSVKPCGGCSPLNQSLYKAWNQFIEIHPFSVDADYLDTDNQTLWDNTKNSYTYDTNFGLNLSLTVKCDLTDFITRNAQLFTEVLGLQVAHDFIYEMAYSTENNAIAEKNRKLALYELDDRDNNTAGLMRQLAEKYDALDVDTSNLNSKCLPKSTKAGVKYSAI